MEAIILAGGKGTRLREIVNDRPKPLADVNGRPFLWHVLNYAKKQKCSHIVISVGYKRDMIMAAFGPTFEGIPITYVQESEPLGTGGAALKSARALKDDAPFMLLNGDTSFEVDVKSLENILTSNKAEVGLALFRSNEENRYSLIKINGSILEPIKRSQKARIGELAHGGVSILRSPSVILQHNLKQKKFSFEDDFLVALSLKGALLAGAVFTEPFIDIGVPRDYLTFCDQSKS